LLLCGLPILVAVAAPPGPTVVDVAIAVNSEGPFAGQFDTLIAAVTATPSVASILDGNGQHTVFAPTDAAFEDLATELGLTVPELVDFLLANPDYLEDVLLYHIAHGRLYAEDVLPKDRINMLIRGRNGFLMQDSGVLTDNLDRTANIIVTDVEAANGIIHAIDAVVLPYAP
ncbi:MAG: fasciclin domain-containing protein, partial [Gammaproteobacteria bacterium]|nr:fasciclin domain-containing protein [Gammaproteobacteria bacterium]